MRVRLSEIAKEAGVSIALVSQVLNGKPVRVNEETRKHILEAADTLGYIPNRVAAGLRSNSTKVIGCIIPFFDTQFYGDLTNAMVTEAFNRGYECILCNSQDDPKRERDFLGLSRSGIIDGLIAVPFSDTDNIDIYRELVKERFPLVFAFRNIPQLNVPYAEGNREKDGYTLTRAAIAKGHRNIGIVIPAECVPLSETLVRKNGYVKAMEEAGLECHVYHVAKPGEEDRKLLEDLRSGKLTMMLVPSSRDAQYTFLQCAKAHRYIPNEVEVIVFDRYTCTIETQEDIEMYRYITAPPIPASVPTSNPKLIGTRAVERLVELL